MSYIKNSDWCHSRLLRLVASLSIGLSCLAPDLIRAEGVRSYIVTTQESRKSTRFTLTEWLRIKERMKLMDVYLAMFSNPQKESFAPELSLYYGQDKSLMALSGIQATESGEQLNLDALESEGESVRGQIWLSNLISKTFGVRTLNIDLGLEASLGKQEISQASFELAAQGQSAAAALENKYLGQGSSRYQSVNFRLFGKNVQDSSLVFKVGEYKKNSKDWLSDEAISSPRNDQGFMRGLELQLYLTGWLGFEGTYTEFMESQQNQVSAQSTRIDYGLYLEISLVRLMAGAFTSKSTQTDIDSGKASQQKGVGTYTGLKISF